MIKWIKNRWSDPVWSKVFASLIWLFFTSVSIIAYKIYNQISFSQTFNSISTYWKGSSVIQNNTIILFLLFILLLSIFKITILDVIKFFLSSTFNGKKYHFEYEYQFNNTNSKETNVLREIYLERSFNRLYIKPTNESLQWDFELFITYSRFQKGANEIDTSRSIEIIKRINEQRLFLIDKKDNSEIILLEDYYSQSFEIFFKIDDGGAIISIEREKKVLFKTDTYFGYDKIIYTASGIGHDFIINVKHVRDE